MSLSSYNIQPSSLGFSSDCIESLEPQNRAPLSELAQKTLTPQKSAANKPKRSYENRTPTKTLNQRSPLKSSSLISPMGFSLSHIESKKEESIPELAQKTLTPQKSTANRAKRSNENWTPTKKLNHCSPLKSFERNQVFKSPQKNIDELKRIVAAKKLSRCSDDELIYSNARHSCLLLAQRLFKKTSESAMFRYKYTKINTKRDQENPGREHFIIPDVEMHFLANASEKKQIGNIEISLMQDKVFHAYFTASHRKKSFTNIEAQKLQLTPDAPLSTIKPDRTKLVCLGHRSSNNKYATYYVLTSIPKKQRDPKPAESSRQQEKKTISKAPSKPEVITTTAQPALSTTITKKANEQWSIGTVSTPSKYLSAKKFSFQFASQKKQKTKKRKPFSRTPSNLTKKQKS